MTTRANNRPVWIAECKCGGDLLIYQARGKRAYLYSRCAVCGFNQQPHLVHEQQRLWLMLPASLQGTLACPLILAAPLDDVCPCCGKAVAA